MPDFLNSNWLSGAIYAIIIIVGMKYDIDNLKLNFAEVKKQVIINNDKIDTLENYYYAGYTCRKLGSNKFDCSKHITSDPKI